MATHSVPLRDGRALAYAVFGAGPGAPGYRHTVLMHHGYLSSRLEGALLEEHAEQLGLRLVVPDRPGYGASDHDPSRTPESVAADVEQLLDALACREPVVMMGVSGGAPYATACAALLPHRTAALLLLVPFAQLGGRAALAATLTPRNLKNLELASQRPWLMRLLLGAVRLVQQVPHGTALLHFGGFAPVDLAAVGAHPAQVARLKRASWEGTRPGICGALRDMQVMGAAPGAALAAVACRAVVWAGDEDATTPLAMARAYGDGIRGAEVRVVEGQGHFLSFRHGREVLASALV